MWMNGGLRVEKSLVFMITMNNDLKHKPDPRPLKTRDLKTRVCDYLSRGQSLEKNLGPVHGQAPINQITLID